MSVTPERAVRVPLGEVTLEADLCVPEDVYGVVLFAQGSSSSRFDPRVRAVARTFNKFRLATLLVDLITEGEAKHALASKLRFDVGLLSERLTRATDWLSAQPEIRHLQIGYFGPNAGAAAAFVAMTQRPKIVGAIVACDGRVDLAGDALRRVTAPTLFIVGGKDTEITALNEAALAQMECERDLVIITGLAGLLAETGPWEEVARLAREWFLRHLALAGATNTA
jgi:putative phosphoribosyl transferase